MSDFKLNCTKFDFHWGSAVLTGELTAKAVPRHLAGFKGPNSKGKE